MKHNLGKMVPFALALGMTLAMSTTVFAAGEVAETGGVEYDTLEAAIEKVAVGGTIQMIADYTITTAITIDASKEFTLDTNDCTITYTGEGDYAITNNGALTITGNADENIADDKVSGNSEFVLDAEKSAGFMNNYGDLVASDVTFYTASVYGSTSGATDGVLVGTEGNITLNNVNVLSTNTGSSNNSITAVWIETEVKNFTVEGGTFKNLHQYTSSSNAYALTTCAEYSILNPDVVYGWRGGVSVMSGRATINGGDYTGGKYYALYANAADDVTITGGAFHNVGTSAATNWAYICKGSVTIESGTFYGTCYYNTEVVKTNTFELLGDNASIILAGTGTFPDNAIIPAGATVTLADDASLTIDTGYTLVVSEGATLDVSDGTLTNNGTIYNLGTITGDVSETPAIVPVVVTNDTATSYYGTLADAVENATEGDTIYIYEDLGTLSDIVIDKDLTIIGDADTMPSITSSTQDNPIFQISGGADVTFEYLTLNVDNTGIEVIGSGEGDDSEITITNCAITDNDSEGSYIVRGDTTVDEDGYHYSLTFTNNTVTGAFQKPIHIKLGSGNYLTVSGNDFDFEESGTDYTLSLTIIVVNDDAVIKIKNNEFDTMQKAISVDSSFATGQWTITENVFTNVTYAFDLSSTNTANTGYSLAYNYFDGVLPTILDSSDDTTYDNTANTSNLVFYPYYKTYFNGTLGNSVNAPAEDEDGEVEVPSGTIATVTIINDDGEEESVACDTWTDVINWIEEDSTVELYDTVTIEETVELDKSITIDGGENGYTIETSEDAQGDISVFEVTKEGVTITIQNCAFDADNTEYLVYGEYAYNLVFENNDIEEGTASLIYMPLNGSNTLRVTTKY